MSIIYQHCAPRDYVLPRVTCYLVMLLLTRSLESLLFPFA